MNLIARDFEKRLKELHRAELERSPELRAEFKRQRKSENVALNRVTRQTLMPVFWNCVFLNIALKTRDASLAGAVISLWAAASAFRWAHQWFQQFYASEDLVVLNLLPLNDKQVFRFQARRYLKAARWTAWELLLSYAVLGAVATPAVVPIYFLPVAALLQTALVLALAVHAASRLHMLPLNGIALILYSTAIAVLILGAQQLQSAGVFIQASHWIFPTGWLNYVLLNAREDWVVVALVVPILGIIYLARFSWAHLRNYYSLEGFEIVPSAARHPAIEEEELTPQSFSHRAGPTEIEDRIVARSFLAGVNWELAGWLERLASRFLNARERVITEFLVAQDPGWSRAFRWSFWMWLVACAVVLFLGQFGGTLVFITGYILASASLPLFGGEWRGMRQTHAGGVNIPAFAVYPIEFNAIALIFLKVNCLRILTALPFLLSFSALAAWRLGQSPLNGLVICAKLLGILLSLQPLFVLFPISTTTNDTSRMPGVWFLLFFPLLLVVLASGVGVFVNSSFSGVLLCYAVMTMTSILLFFIYRRAYRRGRFDLLNQRGQQVG